MSAEVSAEYVHEERARNYANGRFDADLSRFVQADDFAAAVMAKGTSVGGFRELYNRMANERGGMLAQARIESTKEAA